MAAAVTGLVFAGYIATLAPTVTFWDAGELITAVRTLGIPHPPGSPLFLLAAHVWAALVPAGEYAFRTNLFSAFASACGAGCFFLVAHETTARMGAGLAAGRARLVSLGGASAAAIAGAFTFTQWQNSNETEVYAVAMLIIAAMAWLCLLWRRERAASSRGSRWLLLVMYLAGLSVGNHLLALLAGPAVVAFLVATLLDGSRASAAARSAEWAQVASVAGIWALLVGTGLGNPILLALGGLVFLVALAIAARSGALKFALLALTLAAVGVSTYLFLFLRAGQHPVINEAAPSTLPALLDVLRRAQYPVRTPFDDPALPHGPENPGRSVALLGVQLRDYLLYFDWQWARSIQKTIALPFGRLPVRTLATLLFVSLGLRGAFEQRHRDRGSWYLLFTLFLVTGFGLVLYLNFKPGPSQGYELYPRSDDHEVRERDYFFVVSFVVWAVWAGIGAAGLARRALAWGRRGAPALAAAALALALVPAVLNGRAASRRHSPEARLAADWAYDLLNSVPPYGVLFTYGDNDTFPLWWAQEVAGIRRDVTVVCLALANTAWYMRQLRDLPVRPFVAAAAPAVWRERQAVAPTWPLHTMTDPEIAATVPQRLAEPLTVEFRAFRHTYPAQTILLPSDVLAVRVMQQNLGRRPVIWAATGGRDFGGLRDYVVQQGLAFRVETARRPERDRVDIPLTRTLAWETYRYAGLPEQRGAPLEQTAAGIAQTLAAPFVVLGHAYELRGDRDSARAALAQAVRLAPDSALQAALDQLQ